MSYAAVVDSSTLIALARGGVFAHLGQVFCPIFIGSRAEKECQKDPRAPAALRQTQAQTPAFPIVVSLISRSRVYDPNLSAADIEGIEIALARSAILLTQDELQRVEAISAGVQVLYSGDNGRKKALPEERSQDVSVAHFIRQRNVPEEFILLWMV
ncbi:hypothetical protein HYR99_34605 [Candidatus Poribacteria bacterium]|nr:hypothetical protein [Candidatus Poribacteria bacterium]